VADRVELDGRLKPISRNKKTKSVRHENLL